MNRALHRLVQLGARLILRVVQVLLEQLPFKIVARLYHTLHVHTILG